jgi:polar amino acid transport system substrate-binding protein
MNVDCRFSLLMSRTLLACSVLLLSTFVQAQETLSESKMIYLNTAFSAPVSNNAQTGFGDRVLAEAFKRIGYTLETQRLPAERALINANNGVDDGELMRVSGLQKNYINLIQVPEPIMTIDMVLFTKNRSAFVVDGWDSMRAQSLAIITGWKIMERSFAKLRGAVELIKADNAKQLFTLLEKDRVDFIAYSNWSGLGYLKRHNMQGITLLEPPLARPKFYTYLHKKHKKLVPKLAAAIREMKKDGAMQKLFDQILKPYLPVKQRESYEMMER